MNVLVIEYEPSVARLVEAVLSHKHLVRLAETSDAAIAFAAQGEYDLVIVDGGMEADRVCCLAPNAKILWIFGHTEECLRHQGMTGAFLQKPFTAAQLRDNVGELLKDG